MAAKPKIRRCKPSRRAVELLGLEVPARLPKASRVKITTHAVERYIERIRPDAELTVGEARRELRERMGGCRVVRERPRWCGPVKDRVSELQTAGYVVVEHAGRHFALPIVWRDGEAHAVTCLSPSG